MSKGTDRRRATLGDEEIIDLYWARDEEAIRETDRKYGTLLYQLAYNILHDRCDSEECQNDTYLGIWNTIPPTRPASFQAYIVKLMRRIAISRYRENTALKRVPSEMTECLEELLESMTALPHLGIEVEDRSELADLINEFIRGLNERQRYIFIGRYYMSNPIESIAQELSVTNSTVYRELERLRKSFRQHLERNGVAL